MASIEKRSNNSWRLVVEAGYDASGKRLKRFKTIRIEDPNLLKTTKRLKDFLSNELLKFKVEVEAGTYVVPAKMTFADFVENHWKPKYAIAHLARKTLYTYESNLKNRILPTFGHMRMDNIKPLHILSYMDSLSKEGRRLGYRTGPLSAGTAEINHRVLKNIFSRAVEWAVVKQNPVSSIKKPIVKHKKIIPYSEEEVQLLFQALQKAPYHWRIMITLALTSGLRRGELLGLEWKHVFLDYGLIEVVQNVTNTHEGIALVSMPKTASSIRKVSLPGSMVKELKDYYQYKMEEREKIGDLWNGRDRWFVFCKPDGTAFHHETPYQWFRNFTKKNGLRYIRFHDLRHTSATLLINQGVHAKIISDRLGHANITTTMNVYGHALRSADQAAADKFEAIFTNKWGRD